VADNQDFRRYGGLINYLPLTYSVMLIASLSLVAFPFMAGFYSKDFILESAFGQFTFSGIAVYIIATIGAIFTTLYSVKVLYLTFLTSPNGSRRYFGYFFKKKLHLTEDEVMEFDKILAMRHERENLYTHITGKTMLMSKYEWRDNVYFHALKSAPKVWINYWVKKYLSFRNVKALYDLSTRPIILPVLLSEGNVYMTLPLVILAIFSIFFGFLSKDLFIGLGSSFFVDNSLFIHPNHEIVIDTEFAVPTLFKLLPFIFTVSFSIIAIVIPEYYPEFLINFKFSRLGYNIFGLFNQRFLIEMFYNKYITNLVLNLGGQTTKVIDKGSIEFLGPWGLEKALISLSKDLSRLSTGVVTSYALYILIGFIFYIWVYSFIVGWHSSLLVLLLIAVFAIFSSPSTIFDDGGAVQHALSEGSAAQDTERDNPNIHRKVEKLTLKSSPIHQESKRYYSTDARIVKDLGDNTEKLKPEWVTGFTDAEGCFGVVVVKNPELRVGWEIRPVFSISLHKKDLALLRMIQAFFGRSR
jgi:NADH:ubiquinone oxidoreductase subunit 5 (subunit L)/multisubunit Na+/H+ antiporter MnhA subunit